MRLVAYGLLFSLLSGTAWTQGVKEVPVNTLKAKLVGHWQCTPSDIRCSDRSTPELENLDHVLYYFSFAADGSFTQWIHEVGGLVIGKAGTWSIQERGSSDGRWHMLHLRTSRSWTYPDRGPGSLKPSATKIIMTSASTDAFTTIIDHPGSEGDCCVGDLSHMNLHYFRTRMPADFPPNSRSFRTVEELKAALVQAMATPGENERWKKWMACFPLEPGGDAGSPKCGKEWATFAAAYDSPDVDEISALEVSRNHIPAFISEVKSMLGGQAGQSEASKVIAAVAKALNRENNSSRSSRYWGLIMISAGSESLFVPVGITPNNRYIALYLKQ